MNLGEVLDDYLTSLVEENFGEDLDKDEQEEAKQELFSSFNQLFNARLVDAFSDDNIGEVEGLLEAGEFEKIPQLAYDKGIDVAQLLQDVMIEFRDLYLRRQ